MVINKINDSRCTEQLMELPDHELTLDNVIHIYRQVEFTKLHVDSLSKDNGETKVHQAQRSRGRGRGRGRGCAAEVFQRQMFTALSDIEGVEIVVDDILVHGHNQKEHDERLIKVLERAFKLNLKLNSEKSQILKTEVEYVGHKITPEGLKLIDEWIRAISNMKVPENIQDLEMVLGMVAYVAKFIPRLSDVWTTMSDEESRRMWLGSSSARCTLQDKRNPYLGDGTKILRCRKTHHIHCRRVDEETWSSTHPEQRSCCIRIKGTPTEQKYTQIEKEALAVVFGSTKFHKMLYGKSDVTVETDHKPLEAIWKKPIHAAPMRIQRMLLRLQPYEFRIVHISGKSVGLADCLSRLPVGEADALLEDDLMVCPTDSLAGKAHAMIMEATQEDPELKQLRKMIISGKRRRQN